MTERRLLTTAQAAERLGVSRSRVLDWIEQKRLPATRIGRAFVLRAMDVADFAKLPRPQGWPKGTPRGPKKGKTDGLDSQKTDGNRDEPAR